MLASRNKYRRVAIGNYSFYAYPIHNIQRLHISVTASAATHMQNPCHYANAALSRQPQGFAKKLILISENLARECWGEPGAALGKRIGYAVNFREVIGVVQDVYDHDLECYFESKGLTGVCAKNPG
jgi:hypothetical protein